MTFLDAASKLECFLASSGNIMFNLLQRRLVWPLHHCHQNHHPFGSFSPCLFSQTTSLSHQIWSVPVGLLPLHFSTGSQLHSFFSRNMPNFESILRQPIQPTRQSPIHVPFFGKLTGGLVDHFTKQKAQKEDSAETFSGWTLPLVPPLVTLYVRPHNCLTLWLQNAPDALGLHHRATLQRHRLHTVRHRSTLRILHFHPDTPTMEDISSQVLARWTTRFHLDSNPELGLRRQ